MVFRVISHANGYIGQWSVVYVNFSFMITVILCESLGYACKLVAVDRASAIVGYGCSSSSATTKAILKIHRLE